MQYNVLNYNHGIDPLFGRSAPRGRSPSNRNLNIINTRVNVVNVVNVLNNQKKKSNKYYKIVNCKIKKVHCKITKNLQKSIV